MEKAVLAVSFGTSYEQTRKNTIEAIEKDLEEAFAGYGFYHAWTSGMIRKKVLEKQGLRIPSVQEALDEMLRDGVKEAVVAPTQLLEGEEMRLVREALAAYADKFEKIVLGRPLLASAEDVQELAAVLEEIYKDVAEDEMLVFMGHGSDAITWNPYLMMNEAFRKDGYDRFFVGTVEFNPGFEPVLETAEKRKPKKIILAPLMVVAGDHATNDMSGEEEDSWASRLKEKGFETESTLKGLGEYPQVRKLYLSHAQQGCVL